MIPLSPITDMDLSSARGVGEGWGSDLIYIIALNLVIVNSAAHRYSTNCIPVFLTIRLLHLPTVDNPRLLWITQYQILTATDKLLRLAIQLLRIVLVGWLIGNAYTYFPITATVQ